MHEALKKADGPRQASHEPSFLAFHRRMIRAWWYFAIPVATFLILGFGWWYWATWSARQVADEFQRSLAAADYARAYSLCSPDLQQKLGNAEKLKQLAEASGEFYRPWAWDSGSWQNNRVLLNSTSEVLEHSYRASIALEKAGGQWRVASFQSSGSGKAPLRLP